MLWIEYNPCFEPGDELPSACVNTLKTLRHPSLQVFRDVFIYNNSLVLIADSQHSRPLDETMSICSVTPSVAKKWISQLLRGLLFLHSQSPPLVHPCLSKDHLWLSPTTGSLVLGGLELSVCSSILQPLPVSNCPAYLTPPEQAEGSLSPASNIYTLAMLMLELATFSQPYSECSTVAMTYKRASQRELPASLAGCDNSEVFSIVSSCLNVSTQRPSALLLSQMPYFEERKRRDVVMHPEKQAGGVDTDAVMDDTASIVSTTSNSTSKPVHPIHLKKCIITSLEDSSLMETLLVDLSSVTTGAELLDILREEVESLELTKKNSQMLRLRVKCAYTDDSLITMTRKSVLPENKELITKIIVQILGQTE